MSLYTLIAIATCQQCDWTAGPGEQRKADLAAEKHTNTEQHVTKCKSVPERRAR